MSPKDQVVAFIESDRTLTGARNLYNHLPGRSLAFLGSINRMRATPENVKLVCYEMCKLVGIKERNLEILFAKPVKSAAAPPPASEKKEPSVNWKTIDADSADYSTVLKPMAKKLQDLTGEKPASQKKADLIEFIKAHQEAASEKKE